MDLREYQNDQSLEDDASSYASSHSDSEDSVGSTELDNRLPMPSANTDRRTGFSTGLGLATPALYHFLFDDPDQIKLGHFRNLLRDVAIAHTYCTEASFLSEESRDPSIENGWDTVFQIGVNPGKLIDTVVNAFRGTPRPLHDMQLSEVIKCVQQRALLARLLDSRDEAIQHIIDNDLLLSYTVQTELPEDFDTYEPSLEWAELGDIEFAKVTLGGVLHTLDLDFHATVRRLQLLARQEYMRNDVSGLAEGSGATFEVRNDDILNSQAMDEFVRTRFAVHGAGYREDFPLRPRYSVVESI